MTMYARIQFYLHSSIMSSNYLIGHLRCFLVSILLDLRGSLLVVFALSASHAECLFWLSQSQNFSREYQKEMCWPPGVPGLERETTFCVLLLLLVQVSACDISLKLEVRFNFECAYLAICCVNGKQFMDSYFFPVEEICFFSIFFIGN